jgi:hypothetical protein
VFIDLLIFLPCRIKRGKYIGFDVCQKKLVTWLLFWPALQRVFLLMSSGVSFWFLFLYPDFSTYNVLSIMGFIKHPVQHPDYIEIFAVWQP